MPAIATSITRDPLDPSTLKPSTDMQMHGGQHMQHQREKTSPPTPSPDDSPAQPPASSEESSPMDGMDHGAGHAQ